MCNWNRGTEEQRNRGTEEQRTEEHIFEAMVYVFSDKYFRFEVKKSSNLATFGDILKNQGIG